MTAQTVTLVPVDIAGIAQEQIDKWLTIKNNNYVCRAPKAGYYALWSGGIILSRDSTHAMAHAVRQAPTGEELTSYDWSVYKYVNRAPAVKTIARMNAGDILSMEVYTNETATFNLYTKSLFIYLGNDASDY